MIILNFIKKHWLLLVSSLLSAIILTIFLLTTDGISAIVRISQKLNPLALVIMGFCVVFMWALEGIACHIITRRIYKNFPLRYSICGGMIGLFFGAITPFSTGGQPMQILYLRKMGMEAGKAGAIVAVKTIVYQIVMVSFSLIMIFLRLPYFQEQVSSFAFITIIGLLANLVFITCLFFFSANQRLTNKVVSAIFNLLHKMKIVKEPEKHVSSIIKGFEEYYNSTKLMGKSVLVYLVTAFFTILQIILICLVPYLIYLSFGFLTADPVTMVAAQSFVTMVSAFIPLPGASGGAEGSFALYFGTFFTEGTLVPAIFLWRIVTYYSVIFVGIFVNIIANRFKKIEVIETDAMKKLKSD